MTKASLLADFRSDRAKLQKMLDMRRHSLVSHGWVIAIRHSTGSLMVLDPVIEGRQVIDARPSCISRATRLTKQDAEQVCRNGNVRNGAGEIAEPMHEQDALRLQIASLDRIITSLEDRERNLLAD